MGHRYNKMTKEEHQTYGRIGGKIAGSSYKAKPMTCPYCGAAGKGIVMYRYHFDRCKSKL